MQAARLLQVVILMLILAMAASCTTSSAYTSKLFRARPVFQTDTVDRAVTFLEMDGSAISQEGWVTTDLVNGKDTSNQTLALDKLSRTFPADSPVNKTDSLKKMLPDESEPIAKSTINTNGTRTKRTREEH
jgi:ABC-type Fe3+-hydroxamate transport system substrate-binding protein